MWFQKSSCKWLQHGYRNTRYVHGNTIVRRRKNKVEALQDENSAWIMDREALENMATSFYSNLYSNDIAYVPFS